MNTLTDLRQTLDAHADRVTDGETVVRATAVRHRVAVVRRRRRAAGAGLLSLALVAGGGAALWSHDRAAGLPAAPTVLGMRAPETLEALGYTYRTDGRAVTFAGSGSLKVTAATVPRLYSWTTDQPVQVRLVLPDGEIWHSTTSRFGDFVEVPSGQTGTLKVSVPSGSVGLASYVLTDQAPAGYTKDGVTFRRTVAGAPLLAAIVSDRGQVDASASLTVPSGLLGVHLSCSGLPHGDAVHLSFNGHDRMAGTCNDEGTFDPGTSSGSQFRLDRPGRVVTMRAWVSKGVKSPTPLAAGSVPRLQLRVGVYGPVSTIPLGGYRLDNIVEHSGHTYRRSTTSSSPSGAPLHLTGSDVDLVAEMAWHTHGRTMVRFSATGMPTAGSGFADGKASIGDLWVPAGATVRAGIGRHATGTFGIAFYERAD